MTKARATASRETQPKPAMPENTPATPPLKDWYAKLFSGPWTFFDKA